MNCREDFEKLYVRIFNAGTSIDSLVDEKRWYIWTSLLEDNYLARLLLESGLNAKQSGCAFYHCVAAYRNWHLHDVAANRKWHLISSVETEKKLFELIDLSMSTHLSMLVASLNSVSSTPRMTPLNGGRHFR